MNTFDCHKRPYIAKIGSNGRIEVEQVESDLYTGCVYFASGPQAFKAATKMVERGMVSVTREGYMITNKGYLHTNGSAYLGTIVLSERNMDTEEHKQQVRMSNLIHGVCNAL